VATWFIVCHWMGMGAVGGGWQWLEVVASGGVVVVVGGSRLDDGVVMVIGVK
jgi:hypothetical protein